MSPGNQRGGGAFQRKDRWRSGLSSSVCSWCLHSGAHDALFCHCARVVKQPTDENCAGEIFIWRRLKDTKWDMNWSFKKSRFYIASQYENESFLSTKWLPDRDVHRGTIKHRWGMSAFCLQLKQIHAVRHEHVNLLWGLQVKHRARGRNRSRKPYKADGKFNCKTMPRQQVKM